MTDRAAIPLHPVAREIAESQGGLKSYPPVDYEVGREKIREYANAIGAHAPENHERDAARPVGAVMTFFAAGLEQAPRRVAVGGSRG